MSLSNNQFLHVLMRAKILSAAKKDPRVIKAEQEYAQYFASPEGKAVDRALSHHNPVAAFRAFPKDVQERARRITLNYTQTLDGVQAEIRRRMQEEN